MKKISNILFLLSFSLSLLGQNGAITMRDNANIILTNNINLILLQPSNLGIQKIGNLQGGIISNHEQSRVIWQTSVNIGNYTIPFKIGNTQIPFSINKTTAGVGVGKYLVSTYHTATNNTPYPNGYTYFSPVTNMNYNGLENSANAVDRFWIINYADYTTIPSSQFTMTYDAANDLNGIIESELQAQYWNGTQWVLPPTGIVNTVNDNVNSIPSVAQNAPWVLTNKLSPLFIVFSESLQGHCEEGINILTWKTAMEIDVNHFILMSFDNLWGYYKTVATVQQHGANDQYIVFDYDPIGEIRTSYFLIEVDNNSDSTSYYSDFISIQNCLVTNVQIYPNPSIEGQSIVVSGEIYKIEIFDIIGRIVNAEVVNNKVTGLSPGVYIFVVNGKYEGRVIVQ